MYVNTSNKGLIFGKSGSIGGALFREITSSGVSVWSCSSKGKSEPQNKAITFQDLMNENPSDLKLPEKFDFVCFAQGVNLNDSILDFNSENFDYAIDANCKYILQAIQRLMTLDLLHNKASICVVSSIWQELARNNKLSYSVSKAALKGLVLSLVADLAPFGIRINAVLPGPIDNNMTRANLSPAQLEFFEQSSPYGRISSMDEVINAMLWLLSDNSFGITGNFIKIHQGFGDVIVI